MVVVSNVVVVPLCVVRSDACPDTTSAPAAVSVVLPVVAINAVRSFSSVTDVAPPVMLREVILVVRVVLLPLSCVTLRLLAVILLPALAIAIAPGPDDVRVTLPVVLTVSSVMAFALMPIGAFVEPTVLFAVMVKLAAPPPPLPMAIAPPLVVMAAPLAVVMAFGAWSVRAPLSVLTFTAPTEMSWPAWIVSVPPPVVVTLALTVTFSGGSMRILPPAEVTGASMVRF